LQPGQTVTLTVSTGKLAQDDGKDADKGPGPPSRPPGKSKGHAKDEGKAEEKKHR
jgi:hypothetical protein